MGTLLTYSIAALFMLNGDQGQGVQAGGKLIAQGDSLLSIGKALKSVEYFEKAIESGARADGYSGRAKAWYQLDRMDRFILDVETALDLNRSHPYAHYQRALYAMRSRDWSLAKTSCDRALAGWTIDDEKDEVLICRGEALLKLGKVEAAINDLSEGVSLGSTDHEAMRILAMLYHDIDMHQAAIEVLKKLLELDESDATDRVNLGFEMASLGKHRDAIVEYERALQEERNNAIALSNYGYSLFKLGKNDEAYDFVKRSLRSVPNNPFALRTRALIRLAAGDKEKACKDLYSAKLGANMKEVDKLIDQHCVGVKR